MRGTFRPGDLIRDDDGTVLSTVSEAFYGGRKRLGVLLSWQAGTGYGVWLVGEDGKPRSTMATSDVIAAQGAFMRRVNAALRSTTDDGN